ncbi:MAG: hypothetical protein AAF570_20810, partial [Bacteroidota bacterium]
NRAYQYDFFFDNCATRERDVLEKVLGERLKFPAIQEGEYGSLRDLINGYMPHLQWTAFGINILLGKTADQVADRRSAMFLPDYLYKGVAAAQVQIDGKWQPLVKAEKVLLDIPLIELAGGGFFSPGLVMGLLLVFVFAATIMGFDEHPIFKVFDFLFFFLIGVLGVLMLFFWLATDHQSTYMNFNMLWAVPTHLIFAFLILIPKTRNLAHQYARYTIPLTFLFLLTSWWLLPQSTPGVAYALAAALLVRLGKHAAT